jgi:hypothetical protein
MTFFCVKSFCINLFISNISFSIAREYDSNKSDKKIIAIRITIDIIRSIDIAILYSIQTHIHLQKQITNLLL